MLYWKLRCWNFFPNWQLHESWVLILVILEVTLLEVLDEYFAEGTAVLILVILEVTLLENKRGEERVLGVVLILVILEVTLLGYRKAQG